MLEDPDTPMGLQRVLEFYAARLMQHYKDGRQDFKDLRKAVESDFCGKSPDWADRRLLPLATDGEERSYESSQDEESPDNSSSTKEDRRNISGITNEDDESAQTINRFQTALGESIQNTSSFLVHRLREGSQYLNLYFKLLWSLAHWVWTNPIF